MTDVRRLRVSAARVAAFVALLWGVHALFALSGLEPDGLGVHPRRAEGLPGILLAPLVHGSWLHLFSNTLPLLVLGTAMLYGFPRAAARALPIIWLGAGAAVWLFARESRHIGASGLAFGAIFFVLVIGALRRDRASIALVLGVFFLHGSMIWGVLPGRPGVSFEYHLFGALAGALAAARLHRRDPLPGRRLYDWEREPDDAPMPDPSRELLRSDRRPDDRGPGLH